MALIKYYLVDEIPATRLDLIDTAGRALVLRWLPGLGWGSESAYSDFEREVNRWRSGDIANWYDNLVKPYASAVVASIEGYAFQDTLGEYDHLPAYHTATKAFKIYGWVFVPYGAPDPSKEGEITPGPDVEDDVPGPEPELDEDFGDLPEEDLPPPEPTGMSSVARAVVSFAAGGLAGLAAWAVWPK